MKMNQLTWIGAAMVTLTLTACAPKAEKTAAAPAAAGAPAAPMTIKFGSDASYAPFEFTAPSGEITGFDIEIAKAMCEELKATCTFQNQDWDGIIPSLLAKKYDVIALKNGRRLQPLGALWHNNHFLHRIKIPCRLAPTPFVHRWFWPR